MTHSALCRHTCRPSVGGGGRGWTIIRATWSGIAPRYIWLGEKICVAENLKPFISGIGLLNYCIGVAVNEKCDFSWKTDEHYEAWRGSITKIGSNPGLERGSQLSGRSDRTVSSSTMEFHDPLHDLKCESCAYPSPFFLFYFPSISFLFVCCLFFLFFLSSLFKLRKFCISYKRECLARCWCSLH